MLTGLVSVTFRQLTPAEIIKLVKENGLDGIEWGADIHCPSSRHDTAGEIAALMPQNGLTTISYGTYYRAGTFMPFDEILDTAEILDTDNIRVWAIPSNDEWIPSLSATKADWENAVKDSKRIADMAALRGMSVSFEYHAGTLTDSIESTERLLSEINRANIFSSWQPISGESVERGIYGIKRLVALNKLKNIHASFFSIASAEDEWREYMKAAYSRVHSVLLEFVKDNNPAELSKDAALLNLLAGGI
jgi:hypothetical protein